MPHAAATEDTMAEHTIRHRYTDAVLYTGGGKSLREVVEQAVNDGANLARANLAGANLARANLVGANLDGDCKLTGQRPVLQIGPIGSRCAYLVSYITDAGVYVCAGCWFGLLADFKERVASEHGDSVHGQEYAAAIAMIEAHARLWTPEAVVAEAA
jgi:hypothetical protein